MSPQTAAADVTVAHPQTAADVVAVAAVRSDRTAAAGSHRWDKPPACRGPIAARLVQSCDSSSLDRLLPWLALDCSPDDSAPELCLLQSTSRHRMYI